MKIQTGSNVIGVETSSMYLCHIRLKTHNNVFLIFIHLDHC